MMDKEDKIEANLDSVIEINNWIIEALDGYIQSKGTKVPIIDIFMAAHSFHKSIVLMCANAWSQNGVDPKKTFKTADDTFRHAMMELRNMALTPEAPSEDKVEIPTV